MAISRASADSGILCGVSTEEAFCCVCVSMALRRVARIPHQGPYHTLPEERCKFLLERHPWGSVGYAT